MSNNKIVVVILGTTGVGKTKLSIELSKKYNGEVINADALQVYKGLDIITNKATEEERQNIPHHLFNFIEPTEEYSVTEFVEDAIKKIDDIHNRNKIPIIIGGTHYYIQSLLFNNSLMSNTITDIIVTPEDKKIQDENLKLIKNLFEKTPSCTKEEIYELLKKVDPVTAKSRHPNDERRNRRSLEIYLNNKIPQSKIIENQKIYGKKQSFRYRTCCFWLYSEQNILNQRLDDRVDTMIEKGLFDEIKEMKKYYDQLKKDHNQDNLYTRGIFQAIGFKEFDAYLKLLNENKSNNDDGDGDGGSDEEKAKKLNELKNSSIEKMKNATKRYSRKQISWIKNKFLPRFSEEDSIDPNQARLYILDISDVSQWNEAVTKVSNTVLDNFIKGLETLNPREINSIAKEIYYEIEMPIDINSKDTAQIRKRQHSNQWEKYECDVCINSEKGPRILNGLVEWERHKKSRTHRMNVKKQKRAKEKE
ncbi:tRNA isopentenyltransferase [Anaeromyces robustus]|uniref:tRNA dimethylallyltransferase n=1 Tax=Anaeromyces robustus TaxID=1754192 RepID=A0A1Y1WXV6_9FUNG|nr:tRNA isopentenyltransferase [Anaeromyces robustus]|eukprot:ORX78215.1 tRNA isopentenyltransferase [Anaeromyces robustus]